MAAEGELKVSVAKHLHNDLSALLNVSLPTSLHDSLVEYVNPSFEESAKELPYDLLNKISQWTQSSDGKSALRENNLDPVDYLPISLLAGSVTSPSAKLAPYRSEDPQQSISRKVQDRKTITAIINAMFSVLGVGVAAWWIGQSAGWSPESRALLSLFSAGIVAVSEGTLYFLWSARKTTAKTIAKRFSSRPSKKTEPEFVALETESVSTSIEEPKHAGGVRQRKVL